jgi:carboxyvinyl-carboxyphosphonate phosphorylmutase
VNATPRRERLRAILAGKQCVHPASVFDATSLRIAQDLGFELAMLAGSVSSLAVLGAPDVVALTLSEYAGLAHRICRAATLPVLTDADHGYGNALNVMRTVEELETAGIAGMTLEDTALPAIYGDSKTRVTSLEEGVGRMKAAVAARQDKSFVIVGRTSAMGITDDDDALRRIRAYEQAGVDAIFLGGVKTGAQIEKAANTVKIPLVLGGGLPGDLTDRDWLAARNVRICLQGHLPFAAAVQAVYATMKALRDGVPPKGIKGIASSDLMNQVSRDADYERAMKDFLGH